MTAVTVDRAARRRALERRGMNETFWSALIMVWTVGIWFWVIYIAIMVGLTFVMTRFAPEDVTVVFGQVQTPAVFLFVMGIIVVAAILNVHVLSGGTRRSAARGWVLAALALGTTFALASMGVALLVGWIATLQGADQFVGVQTWSTLLAQVFASTEGVLAGIAVALGYRRFGGWLGTLALVVTAGPAALLLDRLGTEPAMGWLPPGVVVFTALLVWLLLRRIPIR